jgi:predicted nucleic acid-binding protein
MVIIDASIVVSCYFKKEKFHKKAKEFLKKLIEQKETILLQEIAFPEIASAIARGTGNPKYAIEFCREIRISQILFLFPLINLFLNSQLK